LSENGELFDAWVMAARIAGPRSADVAWVASVSDITRQRRTEAALRESEARLRRLSAELLAVEERERKRISRELHDSLGQTLSALKYRLEEATAECENCRGSRSVQGKLAAAARVLGAAIGEVRAAVSDLRPSLLDDLGLLAAIGWLCREHRKTHPGVRIRTVVGVGEREVPEPLKITIFRLLQEAMTNIARHSGADLVRIGSVARREAPIFGPGQRAGFRPRDRTRGVGIIGMKERTELSGGVFSIVSPRGRDDCPSLLAPPGPSVARQEISPFFAANAVTAAALWRPSLP